jgi:hypothetical protein
MELTAELVRGKTSWGAEQVRLRETESGWTARAYWVIHGTPDVVEAEIGSEGIVPKRGDPLSSRMPTLRVVAREFLEIGGVFDTATQTGGHVGLVVDYATPNAGGRLPSPSDGVKFSRFKASTTTLNRVYDARKELGSSFEFISPPGQITVVDSPVKGGRGYNVAVGMQEIEVSRYYKADLIDTQFLSRLIMLQNFQAVNLEELAIPPVYGTEASFTFRPGELRYVGYEMDADRGLVLLTHTLAAAPDWFTRWVREDDTGEAVGEPIITVSYPAMDFNGLW